MRQQGDRTVASVAGRLFTAACGAGFAASLCYIAAVTTDVGARSADAATHPAAGSAHASKEQGAERAAAARAERERREAAEHRTRLARWEHERLAAERAREAEAQRATELAAEAAAREAEQDEWRRELIASLRRAREERLRLREGSAATEVPTPFAGPLHSTRGASKVSANEEWHESDLLGARRLGVEWAWTERGPSLPGAAPGPVGPASAATFRASGPVALPLM